MRLTSEGRHSDAVADKIILKIVSENLWRSLCCHSYSSHLQKHLNNSNKHDIKTKTGLLGFSFQCEIVFYIVLWSLFFLVYAV